MEETKFTEIIGTVEEIIYKNPDNGFTVLYLSSDNELINVVGEFYDVNIGEELKLTGSFTTHSTYGYQFKAELCEHQLPATSSAIFKYLSSGVVKGIGPVIARRIVDKFGDDTLRVIESEPEKLAEIKGLSPKKLKTITDEFKQVFGVRTLMLFLSEFSVNPAQSIKIWKRWGNMAVDIISGNPYLLCDDQLKISFQTADNIAKKYSHPLDCYERVSAAIKYVLMHNMNNGHTCLPQDKLIAMSEKLLMIERETILSRLDEAISKKDLVSITKNKPFIALPELYEAELYISNRISLMASIPPDIQTDVDYIIDYNEKKNNIVYEALQKKAIKFALLNEVFILTGGPGTGKTTTLNAIIDILQSQGKVISVCAPTGRAAKRISEVTNTEAKTIHRLLEVDYTDSLLKFSKNEQNPLDSDVIIVDEMSMVDVLLFESLLKAAKPTCKLILVGDYNQLPSVGAGNVLHDLLKNDNVPTVTLKQIFRQAAQSKIVTYAHSIIDGEMPDITANEGDFFFLKRLNSAAASATVIDLVTNRLPKSYNFSPTEDIQVLCPQRKGDLGVMELNRRLQEKLNPYDKSKTQFKSTYYTYRVGDKVMQTKNNYDIIWTKGEEKGEGIFNGDIGIIKMIDRGSQTLAIDFEERVAFYTFDMATELELAYAVTVHKSQGSEFDAVILPVLEGYDKLYYRNLLYTAITRAKKLLIIVGSADRVKFMVNNNIKSVRFTNLSYLLDKAMGEFR